MSVIRSQCKSDEEYLLALRDDFAAKAMLGYMTSGFANFGNNHSVFAKDAYEMADAMLKERAK